jgi:hypothetical protein
MTWGERKPEGNEEEQFPSGFLSPHAFHVEPLDGSNARQGG